MIEQLSSLAVGLKMLRSPRELPAMVVALAVGVGLTVAAYSLIHAVLLTPLPYGQPEDLVQVWSISAQPASSRVLSEADQESLGVAPSPFRAIANYGGVSQSLQPGPGLAPVELRGALVSANLFDVLRVRATAGRTFESNDGLAQNAPIVVSERLVRLGIVRGDLEEVLRLDGVAHRLVGIMPDTFWFPDRQATYWVPLPVITPQMRGDAAVSYSFPALARLAGGVTLATAELLANARLAQPGGSSARHRVRVESHASLLTAPLRPSLLALQAASGLVLLLVCLNVSWLFTARARRLRSTFATMRMLGATSSQVLRTHLVSAVCVAVVAVPCAVLVAWALLQFGLTLESGIFSRTAEPAITAHVTLVAFTVTLLTCVVACLPGAFAAVRGTSGIDLRVVTRGRRVERAAMALQVGLVFAVAAQAIFFAQVLLSLNRTNVGFAKRDFVVLTLESGDSIDPAVQLVRYKDLLQQLDRRGIRAAAVNIFPFNHTEYKSTFERRRSREHLRAMVRIRIVTPSYFDVTGMTATSGRLLRQEDAGASRIVVTDAFAAALLQGRQGRDVIGELVGPNREWTITGVTSPLRQFAHEELQPEVYVLYEDFLALHPESALARMQRAFVLAETPRGVAATLHVLREEVAGRMPDIEVRSASHIRDTINVSLGSNRLVAAASVVFGSVALLLAALGLYAMVSHDLGRRRRENGIRLALGATRGRIAVESVRPIVMVYSVGVCVGIALLLSAKSAIQSVMPPPTGVGYPPLPTVAGAAAAVLLAGLILACYRPVRTAAGTDPATALRTE